MPRRRIDPADLVSVAVRIVDVEGPEQLTLSNVAAELGVRPSALYTHVDGSDGLRRAVAHAARQNLARSVQASAVGVAGPNALAAIAKAYRHFAIEHPGQYRISITIGELEPSAAEDSIRSVLTAVFAAAGLNEKDAAASAATAHASLHGFISMESRGGSAPGPAGSDHFRHMVEVLGRLCR